MKQFAFGRFECENRKETHDGGGDGSHDCCPNLGSGLVNDVQELSALDALVFRLFQVPQYIFHIHDADVHHHADGDGNA